MYLKKSKNNKTGRTYLYIADGYHDKDLFFENTDFSLKEVYNALGYLEPFKESYFNIFFKFSLSSFGTR